MNPDLDLLLRLRDVHPPPSPSWWPPAPGWWLLALLLAVAVWLLVRWLPPRLRKWYQRAQLEREFRQIVARIDAGEDAVALASQLSSLLRRAMVLKTRDRTVAGIHGEAWIELLEAHAGPGIHISGQAEVLTELAYRKQVDRYELLQLANIVGTIMNAPLRAYQC